MKTLTYIPLPNDSRCKWWQAEIPESLTADHLKDEKIALKYFKRGQDLELPIGTLLIDSEQNHHRKDRGYRVLLGVVTEEGMRWIRPTIEIKKFIKSQGRQDLMVGSGDIVAVFRMAIYLRAQEDLLAAFEILKAQG